MFNFSKFSDPEYWLGLLYLIPIYFITFSVHEFAHAYSAYKMGDPTARNMGRLTLNPLKHIDIFGFLTLIFVGFGWAKPVPINPRNFRNPRKGMAISAAAGPGSNFLMAIGGFVLAYIANIILYYYGMSLTEANFLFKAIYNVYIFLNSFCMMNIYFGLFNLIPVPPLDGSRIVSYFLPYKYYYIYSQIERYGFIILMLLLYTGIITGPLSFIASNMYKGLSFLFSFVPLKTFF